MFNALNLTARLSDYIHFEKRRPSGLEYMYGILRAIQKKVQFRFNYFKFHNQENSMRTVEPYVLKEYKHRWYVLALDLKDNRIKSFALDRISEPDITRQPFRYPVDFDVKERFRYCFGIISPNAEQPEEVILSFDSFNGKYIKSLPLHHTQKVLKDTLEEVRISLRVYITHEFYMELLSYGDKVKVLQPLSLRDKMIKAYKKGIEQYS